MLEKIHSEKSLLLFYLMILLFTNIPAKAENHQKEKIITSESAGSFLFGVSYFNAFRENNNAVEVRIEYRSSINFFGIKPFTGITFNSDGGFYTMGGIYTDIILGKDFCLTLGFAAGYYNRGMGIDLASNLEFRTQLELSYLFSNNYKIGISFYHISNGNLGKSNPGAESVSFIFSIPVQ